MQSNPTISVIIPSYNYGRYLERAILSVLKQDYAGDVQLIVSDGGSTDETVSVLSRYTDRITWWSKKDNGFVDAVQRGMQIATGEIIVILSADDYYLPGAFTRAVTALNANPECSFIAGHQVIVEENGEMVSIEGGQGIANPKAIMMHKFPPQDATFFRKQFYDAVGGIRLVLGRDPATEVDLWYRIAHLQPGIYMGDVLGVYQKHPTQMIITSSPRGLYESVIEIIESCERDPKFATRFRLTNSEKTTTCAYWDLLWSDHGSGQYGQLAVNKAHQYKLQIDQFDDRTKNLILSILETPRKRTDFVKVFGRKLLKLFQERRVTAAVLHRVKRLIPSQGNASAKKVESRKFPSMEGVDLEWWRK